jgi:protein gp37
LLTKRPENVARFAPSLWLENWPAHIWIGTTVENQQCADERIPALLEIPAKVRFLSCEPLLGPVNLSYRCLEVAADWVICGGESGGHARPMHPDWARSLRDQCNEADVPFFFKQWGEWIEVPAFQNNGDMGMMDTEGLMRSCVVRKVGKHVSGRLLDGREWSEFPKVEVAA